MIFGSVCSGIEAASVAWESLGWKAAWFSEIEPFPSAVLAHHYPAIVNLGDMTKMHKKKEFKSGKPVDLLVGGTPCQSFSVAGLRKGLADPRGNLALVFLALLDRLRPRWVVWENVPGVLSSGEGRDFGAFLGGLGQLGYGFAYRVLDAQYFGVPQRRRRVFVVGYLGDWRPAVAVLFERHSLSGDPAPSREARKVTPTLSSSGTGVSRPGFNSEDEWFVAPALTASGRGVERTGESRGQDPVVTHALPASHDASEDGGGRGVPLIAGCLQERDAKGADSDTKPGHLIPVPAPTVFPINTQIATRSEKLGEGTGLGIGKDGDPGFTLQAGHHHAIAFGGQHSASQGLSASEKVTPTLDKSKTPAVAIRTAQTSANGHGVSEDKAHTLDGAQGQAVAFTQNQNGDVLTGDVAASMGTNQNATGRNTPKAMTGMLVRRLTPRECERLQGFPDNYTLIPYRGGYAADGPRYKALGNSMAVPVMRWIGERIKSIDAIKKRDTK